MVAIQVNPIENNPGFRRKSFDLEILHSESIFLLSIVIRAGRKSLSISLNDLGLSEETTAALRDAGASAPKVKLLERGNKCFNKLAYARSSIYGKFFVHADPYWMTTATHIGAVSEAIANLQETARAYKEEILAARDSELSRYAATIERIVNSFPMDEETRSEARDRYLAAFPSPEEIDRSLYIEVTGPIEIPSLREQARLDAEIAEAEARHHEAVSLLKMQKEFVTSLRSRVAEAATSASEEFYDLLIEQLDTLSTVGGDCLRPRQRSLLESAVERCQNLVSFNSSLAEVADAFGEIARNAERDNHREVRERIAALRLSLKDELRAIDDAAAAGRGNLARWLAV